LLRRCAHGERAYVVGLTETHAQDRNRSSWEG
jgi:hypothetical protein